MHDENINPRFSTPFVMAGEVDVYYHFGVASDDPVMEALRDVRAVIANGWIRASHRLVREDRSEFNGGAEIIAFPEGGTFRHPLQRGCSVPLLTVWACPAHPSPYRN